MELVVMVERNVEVDFGHQVSAALELFEVVRVSAEYDTVQLGGMVLGPTELEQEIETGYVD
jgi:hypothetical protein